MTDKADPIEERIRKYVESTKQLEPGFGLLWMMLGPNNSEEEFCKRIENEPSLRLCWDALKSELKKERIKVLEEAAHALEGEDALRWGDSLEGARACIQHRIEQEKKEGGA